MSCDKLNSTIRPISEGATTAAAVIQPRFRFLCPSLLCQEVESTSAKRVQLFDKQRELQQNCSRCIGLKPWWMSGISSARRKRTLFQVTYHEQKVFYQKVNLCMRLSSKVWKGKGKVSNWFMLLSECLSKYFHWFVLIVLWLLPADRVWSSHDLMHFLRRGGRDGYAITRLFGF